MISFWNRYNGFRDSAYMESFFLKKVTVMTFDVSSFVNTWLCVSLLNWFLGRIVRGKDVYGHFRHTFLTFLFWMITLRLFLPANFIFGLPSPLLPYIDWLNDLLVLPLFGTPLTFSGILSYIWLFGAVYSLLQFYCRRNQQMEVAKGLMARSIKTTVRNLIPEYIGPDYVICLSKDIETPFVYGFSSNIMLPDKPYSKQTLYYILCHETMHIYACDASVRLLSEVLIRIYWWMPNLRSLSANVSSMVELRNGGLLMDLFSKNDMIGYCEALLEVAHPSFNSRMTDLGFQDAYIGNKNMLYPPITSQEIAVDPAVADEAKSFEVLAFGEPNTDLKTRILYNLSAHEHPRTKKIYFQIVLLLIIVSALCMGQQQFFLL